MACAIAVRRKDKIVIFRTFGVLVSFQNQPPKDTSGDLLISEIAVIGSDGGGDAVLILRTAVR